MFDARERAAEAEFVHERDVAFRTHARRNRMFGRWAGRLLGLKGSAAEEYAHALMIANIERADDETLLAAVQADLAKSGVAGLCASDERLMRKLEKFQAIAKADPCA